MAEIEIREPRAGDVDALLTNLRQADKDELDAAMGAGQHRAALEGSLQRSTLAWVGTVDDVPACAFGVAPMNMLTGEGIPWLLGTPLIDRHRSAFIRRNPAYIRKMQEAYPILVNAVHADNVRSIAWLKRLGFTVHSPAVPRGPTGALFHFFTMGV